LRLQYSTAQQSEKLQLSIVIAMPLYHQIIVTLPKYPKDGLVQLFKRHTKMILDNGGVVRGVEHHGIRPLPERARRKYASVDGTRHFWDARYVSSYFDASPKTLVEVERLLKNEEGVLRYFTVKKETGADRVRGGNYKNIFNSPGPGSAAAVGATP
jgi:ribosomal protein S6